VVRAAGADGRPEGPLPAAPAEAARSAALDPIEVDPAGLPSLDTASATGPRLGLWMVTFGQRQSLRSSAPRTAGGSLPVRWLTWECYRPEQRKERCSLARPGTIVRPDGP
jgi:hypothetical protein